MSALPPRPTPFMLSSAATAALRDIAHHIDLAIRFTASFDYQSFEADSRTVYAVTRCLEIISEASRRLPDDLKVRHPSIAWKDMAGAGNIYRHDYEDVAARHVWNAVQIDLLPLRVVVDRDSRASDEPLRRAPAGALHVARGNAASVTGRPRRGSRGPCRRVRSRCRRAGRAWRRAVSG
jgi:uncharacterized protein with HEPN domain